MKQVLQNLRSGETVVTDVPVPIPRPGQVLVQTAASLVSTGTERMLVTFAEKSLVAKARSRPDLMNQVLDKARREGLLTTLEAALNRLDQPMALGYASAGTIVSLGDGVYGFQVGQRVACGGGGYAVHAEYAAVPQNLIAPLSDDVTFESAVFTTLGAIAMHGFRLAQVQLGERVAVIGLGLLGLLAAKISQAAGCYVLGIDIDQRRVDLANRMKIESVQRDKAEVTAHAFTHAKGCDAILVCADTPSNDPLVLAGEIARDRAHIIAVGAVGLEVPRKVYYEKELVLLNSRSYGPGRYDPKYEEEGQDYPIGYVRWTEGRNMQAFADLLASGHLDIQPLITHRFPIEEAPKAYQLITGKTEDHYLGVVLTYPPPVETTKFEQNKKVKVSLKSPAAEIGRGKTSSGTLSLGVIGAGNYASAVMLPAIKKIPEIRLRGIISASGASAQYAANRYGFDYADSDENRIFEDAQINTVAILTRHNLHARQVQAALRSGKNVFCEKPLAINEAELDPIETFVYQALNGGEQEQAVKPLNLTISPLLMVGFNRRFAPFSRHMQEFFSGRKEPMAIHYRVNAGYIPDDHWVQDPVQGGGRIIGEGCHFIDFLTFLVGQIPQTVTAQALPDRGRYREDNVVMTFTFPDGSLGTVSYLANGDKSLPKERVEVFCAGSVAVLDDYRTLSTIAKGKRKRYHSRLRQDKGHRAEWLAFTNAVVANRLPPIPYDHLFGVTRASFAVVEALRSGEKVRIR